MKTKAYILSAVASFLLSTSVFSQTASLKKEEIKVWGNCGMCKSTIEKAAKSAGASEAEWDEDSKMLTVSYDASKTGGKAIQKAVVATGYDTQDFTATDESYNKLHGCCKYDRKPLAVQKVTVDMSSNKTADAKCCDMPDCGKGGDCCKGSKGAMSKGGKTMDCCMDGKCEKHKGGKSMDCCKDGKCEKHKGDVSAAHSSCANKDCCKS